MFGFCREKEKKRRKGEREKSRVGCADVYGEHIIFYSLLTIVDYRKFIIDLLIVH